MKKITYFATFAAGAILGSVASWQILKKKYEEIVQQEVESIKQSFKNKNIESLRDACVQEGYNVEITKKISDSTSVQYDKEEKKAYDEIAASYKKREEATDIYVITPEEFAEFEDYNTVSLTYFPDDQILTDDRGELIDPAIIGGEENLEHIGDYEEYTVHIRNDQLSSDYEIMVEERSYSEVFGKDE